MAGEASDGAYPTPDRAKGCLFQLIDYDAWANYRDEPIVPDFDRSRANLKAGDGAHLGAVLRDGAGEGFWVEVVGRVAGGYRVRMVDDLRGCPGKKGTEFEVRYRNINRIEEGE